MIAPVCPCRVAVTLKGELVIDDGTREVARFTPGENDGVGNISWSSERVAHFGAGGPTLTLADGVRYDEAFARIDAGLGPSPWCAFGPGFVIDLPPGLVLMSSAPGDDDPLFELHLPSFDGQLIRFIGRNLPAGSLQIRPAPNQTLVGKREIDVEDEDGTRTLAITELAYEHGGAPWRQLAIATPLDEEGSMVLFAQAQEKNAAGLFALATKVAASLAPFG